MASLKSLLSKFQTNDKLNRVARSAWHGFLGGIAGYTAGTQIDTSLLANVTWWKGALTVGALAAVGSVGGNYVQPFIPFLRKFLAPATATPTAPAPPATPAP